MLSSCITFTKRIRNITDDVDICILSLVFLNSARWLPMYTHIHVLYLSHQFRTKIKSKCTLKVRTMTDI